ncbi:MAG: hypothetical protein F4Z31_17460 [Gemmatimonadetes bacterium]|nr:hypothetical protein [Gemmatimonadota bacterium]MYA43518.1 hypothetical protein [Gemmatimonadota bacterium]MYE92881.1 hypothetical protein [Gemmatimonadota bacterium]MYJ09686.1 hypothetical protein [Gemmatimonadota bacterium]
MLGCWQQSSDAPSGEELVTTLEPVASSPAPLSYNDDIALVTEDLACVINSFEFQVHCGERSGAIVGVFGREGDGPGEFRTLAGVERGPDGALAVVDLRLDRLTFFSTDGTYESTVSMPGAFSPDGLWGTRVFGTDHFKNMDFSELSTESPEDMLRPAHMEIDLESGEVVWERSGITEAAEIECGPIILGRPDPRGGYVFRACQELLVFFEHRDDTTATVVPSPTYVEELPNQRDVDDYLEGLARLSGTMAQAAGGVAVARSAMEPYAAGYREDPKMWFLRGIPFDFDSEGRLWVATTRDRDLYSYLDVWVGTAYAGTVRIRDRLLGYDLFGATFAALVERAPGPDGIAERAIDWYDISGLRIGS